MTTSPALRLSWPSDPSFRWAFKVYIAIRLILSGLGLVLWLLGYVPRTPDPDTRPYFEITPVVDGMPGALLGVWQRFDVINYQRVAGSGYSPPELSVFFPLLPLGMRLVSVGLLGDTLLAGLVISNIGCLLALILLHKLSLYEMGDSLPAQQAVLYLAFFPAAFALLIPYSEALFLPLSLWCFYSARRGQWGWAAVAGVAASWTRVSAIGLAPALVWILGTQLKWQWRRADWRWLAAAAPALGLGAFLLWRWALGYASFTEAQLLIWHRHLDWPWQGIGLTMIRILNGQAKIIEYIDLSCVLLMIGLGIAMIKRLPVEYSLYFWSILLINLAQWQDGQPLSAQTRYTVILFPAFMLLGQAGRSPIWHRVILYSFSLLLFYMAGQFILWGWVG